VLNGHKIAVSEHETGKDITAIILSQVLSEVVAKEMPFSADTLEKLILGAYVEKNTTDKKVLTQEIN
jgi:hypothetical protein